MSAIVVKDISKRFKIPHHKKTTLFQNMVGLVKRQMTYEEFWALKDVSFEVQRGETLASLAAMARVNPRCSSCWPGCFTRTGGQ